MTGIVLIATVLAATLALAAKRKPTPARAKASRR